MLRMRVPKLARRLSPDTTRLVPNRVLAYEPFSFRLTPVY